VSPFFMTPNQCFAKGIIPKIFGKFIPLIDLWLKFR
jgi:hypothetical protein